MISHSWNVFFNNADSQVPPGGLGVTVQTLEYLQLNNYWSEHHVTMSVAVTGLAMDWSRDSSDES